MGEPLTRRTTTTMTKIAPGLHLLIHLSTYRRRKLREKMGWAFFYFFTSRRALRPERISSPRKDFSSGLFSLYLRDRAAKELFALSLSLFLFLSVIPISRYSHAAPSDSVKIIHPRPPLANRPTIPHFSYPLRASHMPARFTLRSKLAVRSTSCSIQTPQTNPP